ncbi:MAG TPA: FxLYD domain-containing protein [Candidatus Dormibacteraeota bacterium]|nr:FxLYD domain-containing protein [Candidatus Dormibacteraeota bacterium]
MGKVKYLKGECSQCGGPLGFPADSVGTTSTCPHCGETTELMLAQPKEEPAIPRKTVIWTLIGVVILVVGLGGAIAALHLAQKRVARQKEQATPQTSVTPRAVNEPPSREDPILKAGFRVSPIKIDKAPGTSLIYAVGNITNASARQRFGVKVELDLYDAAGQKVGGAKDYQQSIEPHGVWEFRALVVEGKAASAKVASVKEEN